MDELLDGLIDILCGERGEKTPRLSEGQKFNYFRALVNVRPPLPVSKEFLTLQDDYLQERLREIRNNGYVFGRVLSVLHARGILGVVVAAYSL